MGLLDGRCGLVFGVANERSIAWNVAKVLSEEGATCGFAHLPGEKMERRVRRTLEAGGLSDAWMHPCNAASDEDLEATFAAAKERFDKLDFVIHSIAFADREYLRMGNFSETPREAFVQALDISAYTLLAMARLARPMMPQGGSIVAMTYYGSTKVIPGYNVMGVAKAALECTTRYLAAELGESGIRVNTVSAGPIRTLSSMAVSGIDDMFDWVEKKSPLRRNVDAREVGRATAFLVSDLSSAVTGENLFVDCGYNLIGL